MLLRNHWYVAAWSDEVGRDPLGRVLLGDMLCLYRTADGRVVALEDRCPHRNLPLSEGRRRGDGIECGYHGMVFEADGACSHVPGMAAAPDWARVRRYPAAERNGWAFVWMGAAEDADEAAIPDFHVRIPDPDWLKVSGHLVVGCGYRLILDNLLDLSHLTYVHASTTGNTALAEEATITTDVGDDRVRVVRRTADIPAAPAYARYGGFAGNVDRWQTSRYMAPVYIHVNNGAVDAGDGADADVDADLGQWGFTVYHALTPETAATTHQFWCMTLPERMAPPDATDDRDDFLARMHNIIAEDTTVYEAQQAAIDLDADAADRDANPLGAIPADEGLLAMRRIIRRLHGAEDKARKAT